MFLPRLGTSLEQQQRVMTTIMASLVVVAGAAGYLASTGYESGAGKILLEYPPCPVFLYVRLAWHLMGRRAD